MCFICGQPDTIRCNCQVTQPLCDNCSSDSRCTEKMDAQCVIYHLNTNEPSQLQNLGFENGANLEDILEALDDLIGSQFNIPFTPSNSSSIAWTPGGSAGHSPTAEVVKSPDADNILEKRSNGLYVPGTGDDFKVKVNAGDTPDYLVDQISGGTSADGIISVDKIVDGGKVKDVPSINILLLLQKIKNTYPTEFCALINSICVTLGWVADELECLIEDFEVDEINSGNDLPEPTYSFIDNDVVYFISQANSTGKLWTIDPYTYANNTQIVYINETRSGQPYGVLGGTYTSGAPYRGNAISPYAEPSNTYGAYYDPTTRTLFVHGNKTFGCDFYDFAASSWGKIAINGSVTSSYNTTTSSDAFTHTYMSSNQSTNLIITGWGTNSGNRGTKVILIDKALREVILERDVISTPIVGFSSNPFNNVWLADISPANEIIVAKGQSTYRNVAILNPNLTFKQELVLPISTLGAMSGFGTQYVQGFFYDTTNDKIYLNDLGGRVVYVYSKLGSSYVLSKTFNLNNNRGFAIASVVFAVNPITDELFWDIFYGDNNFTYNPNGTNDALESELISYKVNRSTLEIERIYIGQLKAVQLNVFFNGDVINSLRGNHNPTTPTTDGTFSLQQLSSSVINTGEVQVNTLKEVNVANNAPTGNTKPNVISDPDYIPNYQDTTQCPIVYNLNCPADIIMTASTTQATVEFGLGVQVVNNPSLAKIRAVFDVGGVQKGFVEWNIPNPLHPNAFFATVTLAGVVSGNTVDVSIIYLGSSNNVLNTCTDVSSYLVP